MVTRKISEIAVTSIRSTVVTCWWIKFVCLPRDSSLTKQWQVCHSPVTVTGLHISKEMFMFKRNIVFIQPADF